MMKALRLAAVLVLVLAGNVIAPAAANHMETPSDRHNAEPTEPVAACGYTPETSDGANTHVTGYGSTYTFRMKTDDNNILGPPLGNNNNGWGTVEELSVSTIGEDGSTTSPTCADLAYSLVLLSSPSSLGGYEVGRWTRPGNGTTTLEFFPGDDHVTFYDHDSPQAACHYVEVSDPIDGTLYDRSPDTGCAVVEPSSSGANSYR